MNLPEAQNRWDSGPMGKSDLTKSKFKKILSTQKKNIKSDSYYDFIAFDKKNGQIIGHVSIMDISRGIFQNGYLGYGVLSHNWGKGYGTEMSKAAFEIAFKTLKLHRLEAGIEPSNKRSIALAKSLNMRKEGVSKRRLFLNEKWVDIALYAITTEEFGVGGAKGDDLATRR